MRLLFAATALLLTTFFLSCKDEYSICSLSKSVNFTGGFYQRTGNVDVAVKAPSLSVTELSTLAPITIGQQNAPALIIPLDPTKDSARYIVAVSNALQDTVTIVYTSKIVNLSPECGDVENHSITKFYSTLHTIDSVKIIAPQVTNDPIQNVKIYF